VIRLRALGALELRTSDGQELRAVLAQPKRAALLAYLAVARPRGAHRRDALLPLFWPEHDTEHARNALSQAVHFLRRALGAGALFSTTDEQLGLEWGRVWCDAVAFEEALGAGRLGEAVELYRGDLLENFHVANAPEFDRWLDAERARLADRYAKAVGTLAEEREAAGDFDGALAWWRRLAARDGYNSRVALRLMRAMTAAGDRAGAVHHARAHETLLRDELDIAPDPEIGAFVRELQADPVPVRERPRNDAVHPSGEAAVSDSPRSPRRRRRTTMMAGGVLALLAAAGGVVALTSGSRAAAIPTIRSIAVLPFENLSGDSTQQPFADGLHDALITELARYPDLSVTSRTSVMQHKGKTKLLPEIARELKVDGVVEGTLVWEGGRVRMNAQLVHAPSDRHLWAQAYSRDLRDVLLLQAELAEAIAREVRVAAAPLGRRRRLTPSGPSDSIPEELRLRELYLRGRRAELSRSKVGVETAKEYYRRAIEQDSSFALAYAGLAGAYGLMADYKYAPVRPALDSAFIMARRAVALDSTLPEARTALAITLGNGGQFEAAEREFLQAIRLGPSNAHAHYWYSVLLVALGRGDEALRESKRAEQLDPFGPRGLKAMQRYALWLMTGERPYMKLPVTERRPILKLEPGEPWARAKEGVELAMEGRCAEGRAEIAHARQLAPGNNFRMLPFVGWVDWLCGERGHARSLLGEMKQMPDVHDNGMRVAWLHTVFGETDSAFVWLERETWTMAELSGLSADQVFDPLRSDPRFAQVMRRTGIRTQ
jgi:DNA-binding SARP family transcriptional activator/TolB-like protein/Flp pilus assembly protein TadD